MCSWAKIKTLPFKERLENRYPLFFKTICILPSMMVKLKVSQLVKKAIQNFLFLIRNCMYKGLKFGQHFFFSSPCLKEESRFWQIICIDNACKEGACYSDTFELGFVNFARPTKPCHLEWSNSNIKSMPKTNYKWARSGYNTKFKFNWKHVTKYQSTPTTHLQPSQSTYGDEKRDSPGPSLVWGFFYTDSNQMYVMSQVWCHT